MTTTLCVISNSFVLHPSFSVQAAWLSWKRAVFVAHGRRTGLRMDHVCKGLVEALACGWTTRRVGALGGQRWGVAGGESVMSLQVSVADRGGDTWGAVVWSVVSAGPESGSQLFVLTDRVYTVWFSLQFPRMQSTSISVPVSQGWSRWRGLGAGFAQAEAHGRGFTWWILEGAVLRGGEGHRWRTSLWRWEVIAPVTILQVIR